MNTENNERKVGILLHVSSLPGRYGIGTLGKSAYDFVDILSARRIGYWQVLPLVRTSFGDSPYQSVYGGSGNPYFIDPDILCEKGLLTREEAEECVFDGKTVDYAWLYNTRYALLKKAFSRFDVNTPRFKKFVRSAKFESYALFCAIKEKYNGASFDVWDDELKFADKKALEKFKRENMDEYLFELFLQYEFFDEWLKLKKYANGKSVGIIGDIPLYVAYDSADVWGNPELFKLDKNLKPKKVAGVPPDYFSATGQLWGNPVYDWEKHKESNFEWWTDRFNRAFELYDVVRVDHFRGFDRYYEIPAGEKTAINGKWVNGPKYALFKKLKEEKGNADIIAEDLGTIDEGVHALMKKTGFPGMKVLEFAFDGNPNNPYLPENIGYNSVSYTGTHDNDTLIGLINSLDDGGRKNFFRMIGNELEKLGVKPDEAFDATSAARAMIFLTLATKSKLAVVPVQDIFFYDSDSRMNTPSVSEGNWKFRLESFDLEKFDEFAKLCKKTGRSK